MAAAKDSRAVFFGFVLALVAAWSAVAAETSGNKQAAEPIACGTIYEVQEGDWLHRIALRAYGEDNYTAIYQANRSVLRDMSEVSVGVRLLIPCLDGTGPRTRRDAEAMGMLDEPPAEADGTATASAPSAPPSKAPPPDAGGASIQASVPPAELDPASVPPERPTIGLLSGRGFPPFADPRLPEGGMIADLVKRSLTRAARDRSTRISFEDDWPHHLRLLGNGTFDVSFPWFRPDCARADRLTGMMRETCTGFIFSNPLYEVGMGFFVRAGDPLEEATTPEALYGKRICRPAGKFTFDLEQAGLLEPNVTRVIPPSAGDCFAWLMGGDVDAVSLEVRAAAGEIRYLGLDGRVVPVAALASTLTLHVVAAESSSEGRTSIDLINAGLSELQMSGKWFEVVARHQGAYAVFAR